jgi:hypothetical protein
MDALDVRGRVAAGGGSSSSSSSSWMISFLLGYEMTSIFDGTS